MLVQILLYALWYIAAAFLVSVPVALGYALVKYRSRKVL